MTLIHRKNFNQFRKEFPEMQAFYPQLSSASDREFMYDNFFRPADELDDAYDIDSVEFDENDYEYQQALYL